MRDHGCQPTALACLNACRPVGMQQAFTRDNTPKGHAETERVRRRLNAAGLWRQAWTSPVELIRALDGWITDAHQHDLPAVLGDQAPSPVARHDDLRHRTPFAAT